MKRKFRVFAAIAMVAAMMLMLSSCLSMEIGININEDGTYQFYSDVTMAKAMLSEAEMSEEDLYSQLEKSASESETEGTTIERISKTVKGEEYIGVRMKTEAVDKEKMLEAISESGSGISIEYKDTVNGNKTSVEITIKGESESEQNSDMNEYIAQGMMTTTFKVNLPYEVTETNGVLSEDKKSVEIDIIGVMAGSSPSETLTFSYVTGGFSTIALILIIVGAVLLIAVIIVVIAVMNKRGNATASEYMSAQTVIPVSTVPEATPVSTVPEATPVEAAPEAVSSEKKFCSNCGSEIAPDSSFCPNCGAKSE